MKNVYLYDPEICEGDFCPLDCDRCPKSHEVEEHLAEEAEKGNRAAPTTIQTDMKGGRND